MEVAKHFPSALGVDDFIARLEMALAAYGFTGDNAIAMSNLCRDESCMILEDKIESVFGSCFSTHGLGGVLTCGVIGMGAGLSHSPVENVSCDVMFCWWRCWWHCSCWQCCCCWRLFCLHPNHLAGCSSS